MLNENKEDNAKNLMKGVLVRYPRFGELKAVRT
jgi:hypothetical protein